MSETGFYRLMWQSRAKLEGTAGLVGLVETPVRSIIAVVGRLQAASRDRIEIEVVYIMLMKFRHN